MKRITITIEESLYDKLPKYGKSGVINLIVKQHYQREGFEQLYETIKRKLLKDADFQSMHQSMTTPSQPVSYRPNYELKTLAEEEDEQQNDYLKHLILEKKVSKVWDTSTGEEAEVTPEDVQELIKRGQVR